MIEEADLEIPNPSAAPHATLSVLCFFARRLYPTAHNAVFLYQESPLPFHPLESNNPACRTRSVPERGSRVRPVFLLAPRR